MFPSSLKVRAKTGAGYGDFSDSKTTQTLEDYPGPPTSLALIGRNETCLSVSWKPPTVKNGVITEYKVRCLLFVTYLPHGRWLCCNDFILIDKKPQLSK